MRRPARSRSPGAGRSSKTSRRRRAKRAGRGADLAGFLDEPLLLDETAKILLVQPDPGQRLDRALQLQKRKGGRHQFEPDRPVFDLAAQPAERGGEDAAVVERHRSPGAETVGPGT